MIFLMFDSSLVMASIAFQAVLSSLTQDRRVLHIRSSDIMNPPEGVAAPGLPSFQDTPQFLQYYTLMCVTVT